MSEVIIFYMENADAQYPSGPAGADEDGDLAIDGADKEALAGRMEQAIKVLRG
jgi:hypothetical protein